MDSTGSVTTAQAGSTPAQRSDAGAARLTGRDVDGLLLAGDMYGAPYDLLASFFGVRAGRLRGIVARWRRAGYAQTARPGLGPAWCWLTRSGLAVTGQRYAPARPALARLAHIRAVLAVRPSLEAGDAYQDGRTWWRSERRIHAAAGGHVGTGHVPDVEVFWPDIPASGYPGQCWAIEAELTPKPLARTAAIIAGYWPAPLTTSPGLRRAACRVMTGWCTWPRRRRAAWSSAPPPACRPGSAPGSIGVLCQLPQSSGV